MHMLVLHLYLKHLDFMPPQHLELCKYSSVTELCLTLCDTIDCSIPGFPVLYQLLGLAQTHARQVGDAIQPSHPLLAASLAFNLSQHHGLFQ